MDDSSHGEVDALKHVDLEEPSYLDVALDTGADHLTLEHLCSHTPALPDRCLGCRHGKHAKSPSKRRPLGSRGIAVQSDDALESPFGACVHMDHAIMAPGSRAASVARSSLQMLDERTQYAAVFPSSSRSADTFVSCHHLFDSVNWKIR